MINFIVIMLILSSTIIPTFAQEDNLLSIQNETYEVINPQDNDEIRYQDYVGWGIGIVGVVIGIIGVVIAVFIHKKQSKTEEQFRQIQNSVKSNSLKIINYYLQSLMKDLEKTASIVKDKMSTGNFEVKDLKQLLQDHHKDISEMIDILNRELSFVRPYLAAQIYDNIYAAAHLIQEHNKYDELETKCPDPALWLNNTRNSGSRIKHGIDVIVKELSSTEKNITMDDSERKFQRNLALSGILFNGVIAIGTMVFATGAALWIASSTLIASVDNLGNDSLFSLSLVTTFQQLVPIYTVCGFILILVGFIVPMIKLR